MDPHLMTLIDAADWDRAWLQDRLDPEEYFLRLLQSPVARRTAWLRDQIEGRRQVVRQDWRDGDELWYWRFRIDGGISGSHGIALLRGGEPVRIWHYENIL